MKKLLLTLGLLLTMCFGASAIVQVVSINGETFAGKSVKQLIFNEEEITVVFDDGSTTNDVQMLDIMFNGETGIQDVRFYDDVVVTAGEVIINGVKAGASVQVVDVQGRVVQASKAQADAAVVNVESLPAGVYVLKCGGKVVKFIKK